ncbi:MAG: hypothetical protein JST89_08485 [Cyanobacteria bacterium SZAS-4]|nr:hypothetical protein [Cyanobacteria bacterium SZAS-4]
MNRKLAINVAVASILFLSTLSENVRCADAEYATLSSGSKVKIQRITRQPEAEAPAFTILYESKQSTAAEQKREKDEVWKWLQPQADKQPYKLVRLKAMIVQKFNFPSGPLHGAGGMYIRDYTFQKDKTGWHEIVEHNKSID